MHIAFESPDQADAVALIAELDDYQRSLYPPESVYALDLMAVAARALWLELMGTPCPVEIVAALPLDLLDHPPDEVTLTRAQLLSTPEGEISVFAPSDALLSSRTP